MKKGILVLLATIMAASVFPAAYADALLLHGTGEGLATGQTDPNWTIAFEGGTPVAAVSAIDPNGAWIAPNAGNTWIGVAANSPVPTGLYAYTTTFVIGPGLDPSTAQISGNWWSDDPHPDNGILLNGVLVSGFDGAVWFDADPANAFFSISSGFVAGLNSLTFLVRNTGGPAGTLVQNLSGSVVPEPGTLALLGLGLAGLGLSRRRKAN